MNLIKALIEWWNAPQICEKHGVEYICHGYNELWDCPKCLVERMAPYHVCKCDNWRCDKKNH